MASSSSSSRNHQWIYDVFISFTGAVDIRDSFVSDLYTALKDAGVNAFVDDEKLVGPEELKPELMPAINVSRISLVVLSRGYAASTGRLDELVRIMERNIPYVMPIFYDVQPSDVRKQTGEFSLEPSRRYAGAGHRGEVRLMKWRTALTKLGNLSGWDLSTFRTRAEAVAKIVDDVLTKLDGTFLSIAEFPVGLDAQVEEQV